MQPFTLMAITANDVRTPEREQYLQFVTLLEAELQPVGAFEVLHAAEIVRAHWRLRHFAHLETTADSEVARTSLDRARSHAHTIIRRTTAELRRSQTERLAKQELSLPLPRMVALKDYLQLTGQKKKGKNEPTPAEPEVADMEKRILNALVQEEQATMPQEMKRRTQSPSQTQPPTEVCNCGSGLRFERCCGHWSKAA